MISDPKVCPETATVGELRDLFLDDHVHAALVVDAGRLLAVIERGDLDVGHPDVAPARSLGGLADRVVAADTPLEVARRRMVATGRRRLAAVDQAGMLAGLLCMKSSWSGFCCDEDIRTRSA